MKIFNIVFIGWDGKDICHVNTAICRAEDRTEAEQNAKVNEKYFREKSGYASSSISVIELNSDDLQKLLDGEPLPKTWEEADWPELIMNPNEYLKLASAQRIDAMEVTLPSGAVWKLREPPIQQFVIAGKLPASLAAKMAEAATNGNADDPQAMLQQLTPEDLLSNLEFGRDLLLHCAVEPKITLGPTTDDAIAPEDILPEDFMFLMSWVLSGGKSGESLSTFRPE